MSALIPLSFSRLSTFEQCPAKFEHLYITKRVRDEGNEFSLYGTRAHEALELYAKKELNEMPEEFRHWTPLVDKILSAPGEKYFEFQMAVRKDRTPCYWFSKEVWLRGVADVLVVDGDTAYCVDWKAGKPKVNPTQLQIFAALIFALHPKVNKVKTLYVWLNHNSADDAVFLRHQSVHIWNAVEPRFTAVQDAVELGMFKTKPSGLCRYCPAKAICGDAKL